MSRHIKTIFLKFKSSKYAQNSPTEVAHSGVQLNTMEFVVAHGGSKFVKAERVAAWTREDKTSTSSVFINNDLLPNCCFVPLTSYL